MSYVKFFRSWQQWEIDRLTTERYKFQENLSNSMIQIQKPLQTPHNCWKIKQRRLKMVHQLNYIIHYPQCY